MLGERIGPFAFGIRPDPDHAHPDHAHHDRARGYWEAEAFRKISFCRVTMLAFLRRLTNARVMHGAPLTPAQAWKAYQGFARLPEVSFLGETIQSEQQFVRWISLPEFAAHRWTDAWIAAIAHTHAARVVSFDADFSTFPELNFLHLRP